MTPFFVTGLPRSRTAWLANLFTTGNTLCYHDTPFSPSLLSPLRQVGFAGPETAKDFAMVRNEYPSAPWLVVTRNSKEALAAFKKWAGDDLPDDPKFIHEFWEGRCELISNICMDSATSVVGVQGLDSEDSMRLVWSHLMIEAPFDAERFQLLTELNVQQDKKKGLKRWLQARY